MACSLFSPCSHFWLGVHKKSLGLLVVLLHSILWLYSLFAHLIAVWVHILPFYTPAENQIGCLRAENRPHLCFQPWFSGQAWFLFSSWGKLPLSTDWHNWWWCVCSHLDFLQPWTHPSLFEQSSPEGYLLISLTSEAQSIRLRFTISVSAYRQVGAGRSSDPKVCQRPDWGGLSNHYGRKRDSGLACFCLRFWTGYADVSLMCHVISSNCRFDKITLKITQTKSSKFLLYAKYKENCVKTVASWEIRDKFPVF